MSFTYTYSREQLQGLQAEYRKEQLFSYIDQNLSNGVLEAAKQGKTEFFWIPPNTPISVHTNSNGMVSQKILMTSKKNHLDVGSNLGLTVTNPPPPTFTNEELISALLEKFPGVHVDYQYSWVETRPGVKEERKGILIDWS